MPIALKKKGKMMFSFNMVSDENFEELIPSVSGPSST